MDRYIIEKLRHRTEELSTLCVMQRLPLEGVRVCHADSTAFAAPDFDDSAWAALAQGEAWGGRDAVVWMRAPVSLSVLGERQDWELHLETGPRNGLEGTAESLLYLDGMETCGLDNWHTEVRLSAEYTGKGRLCLALRCWAALIPEGAVRRRGCMELRRVYAPLRQLAVYCHVLLETACQLEDTDWNRITLLQILDKTFALIDYSAVGTAAFYTSCDAALASLLDDWRKLPRGAEDKPVVDVCGHTHIDMAWLWQLEHTREKAARSFSTVLNLMEQYPDYRFSQSTPFLYELVREKYPALFAQIRERIEQGRWEITGGMWVEPDTNLTGGESLVRQLLLGKSYMKREFGVECKTLWLPDVFGYCAALPQLLKKSGIDFFWTNKMSWNQYNRFPYDTFYWRGMDGSEVLTQLGTCPEKGVSWGATYNGVIAPWEVKGVWDAYRQKDCNRELLMPFGWGDGGGGPTREMLDAYPVMQNLPGIPRIEMHTCEEFAQHLQHNVQNIKIPVWDGEMYFEYHRGTYTSQAWIKRANRKTEILYHNAEFMAALADVLDGTNRYPKERLTNCWKSLCVNQFHDILPGSSIHAVYEDARVSYERLLQDGKEIQSEAQTRIVAGMNLAQETMVVFNTLAWGRNQVLRLPQEFCGWTLLVNGKKSPSQTVTTPEGERQLVYLQKVPALGYAAYPLVAANAAVKQSVMQRKSFETPFYSIRFNDVGQIEMLYDKAAERQVLSPGAAGNLLMALEDKPYQFDAWNVEIDAFDKIIPITDLQEFCVLGQGPLETTIRVRYRYHASTITQFIALSQVSRQIRFDTVCDWHERQTLLKTGFDVDMRARNATFDVQFGNLERPTHDNTSWDRAQFEVCMHKWFDLSEDDYGVAVLNDCKYGGDVKGSNLRLTLIKSATYPDPAADQGMHRFTYALLPHVGGWRGGNVVREAYELNLPLQAWHTGPHCGGTTPTSYALAQTDAKNIMVETIKKAEDGDGIVLRIYEFMRRRGPVTLSFGTPVCSVAECDLMENDQTQLSCSGNGVRLNFTPYEIKTLRIRF